MWDRSRLLVRANATNLFHTRDMAQECGLLQRIVTATVAGGMALAGMLLGTFAQPQVGSLTYPGAAQYYGVTALAHTGVDPVDIMESDAKTSLAPLATRIDDGVDFSGDNGLEFNTDSSPTVGDQEHPVFKWMTFVANSGGQEAVDACLGGLTDMTVQANLTQSYLGYFPIHNECGGEQILNLAIGDQVFIDGYGAFEVIQLRDVEQGDTTRALAGLGGQILVQTCHDTGLEMRVVALETRW